MDEYEYEYEYEYDQYDHEIPHHFICPISLQIMNDPVTVATGITYDRDSIQRWQLHNQNNTCPVTNQPLPITTDFTPNHTLRRLIQSWRVSGQVHANQPSSEVKDFFKSIVLVLQNREINNLEHGIKEVLHVMLTTCTWPRNCSMMVDSGVVFELVELELGSPEKGVTELIMGVLFYLCSSADGRAQLLGHAAGLAVITKRITKVSQKVDERALMIISLISKYSGTDGVLKEMMRVGTVEKLCMVLQVNGVHSYSREKAREMLKRHSNVWKDSPCLDVTLLTRYPS